MILDTPLSARPAVITEQITPALCAVSNLGLGGPRGGREMVVVDGVSRTWLSVFLCDYMRLLGYLIWTIQRSEQLPLLSISFSCPEPERSSQGSETGSAECCFPSKSLKKCKEKKSGCWSLGPHTGSAEKESRSGEVSGSVAMGRYFGAAAVALPACQPPLDGSRDKGWKVSRSRPSPPPLTGGGGEERSQGEGREGQEKHVAGAAAGSPSKSPILSPWSSAGLFMGHNSTMETCWGASQFNEGHSSLNGKLQIRAVLIL